MSPRLRAAVVVLLSTAVAGAAEPRSGPEAPRPAVVVLDPGHGGENRGAPGLDGRLEQEVTLTVARRVQELLEQRTDARVVLTREGDVHVGLRERAQIANQLGADAFVSIHCNSTERPGPRGFETFFLSGEGAGLPLHRDQAALRAGIGASDTVRSIIGDLVATAARRDGAFLAQDVRGGLRATVPSEDRGLKQGAYTVLVASAVPATVVELGFLNHPEEGPLLIDAAYQERMAQGLARGIVDYLRRAGRLTS